MYGQSLNIEWMLYKSCQDDTRTLYEQWLNGVYIYLNRKSVNFLLQGLKYVNPHIDLKPKNSMLNINNCHLLFQGLQPFSQYMARGCHLLNTLKGGMYFKTDVFIDFAPLSYNDRADLVVITNRSVFILWCSLQYYMHN